MSNIAVKTGQADDAAYNKAWGLFEAQNYEDAIKAFEDLVKNQPDARNFLALGRVLEAKGDYVNSVKKYIEAVKIDNTTTEAYVRMGDIYAAMKQDTPAIENYAQAIASDPSNPVHKSKLVRIVSGMHFKKVNPNLKGVLLECLETQGVDLLNFGRAWLSIICSGKVFMSYYVMGQSKNYGVFKNSYSKAKSLDALADPFFLTGLGNFIVSDTTFERFCLYLRRYLLESREEGKDLFLESENAEFIPCALGKYIFNTEYLLDEEASETALVEKLKADIEKTDTPKLSDLGLYSCYRPLYSLSNAKAVAAKLKGGDHVSQIPKAMIEEYFEQQELKKAIQPLFKITDKTSLAVQEQYEEFPYPRWTTLDTNPRPIPFESRYIGKKIKILVAGCGTGHEVLQMALNYPDAEILAVDLSRTSIAYALTKQKEFGIKNVEFRHGDIMALGELDQKFDLIASSGVLHHLKDPAEGWKILNGLLKPGGVMRIALYSRLARRHIIKGREIIAKENIGSDDKSIKAFRKNLLKYFKLKEAKAFNDYKDFFTLSECRDLLFHVQEHQFDPEQIKSVLAELKLDFLGMYIGEKTKGMFTKMFPNDPEAKDLSNWAKYEQKYPDLFIGMYVFWCEKPAK